jgi:mannose-1-phosphate guanylyltransferase
VVPTDDGSRVLAFVEKPAAGEAPTNLINAGTYVLEPSVIDLIEGGRRVSIERETFPELVARGTLYAMDGGSAYWIDTGTPQDFLQAQLDIIDDGYRGAAPDGAVAVDPCASVSAGATIERSVIGPGAVIEADAEVAGSVVMAGARVGAKARVHHSIIGPHAEVGPGATVEELSVLGEGVTVAGGEVVRAVRLPGEDE